MLSWVFGSSLINNDIFWFLIICFVYWLLIFLIFARVSAWLRSSLGQPAFIQAYSLMLFPVHPDIVLESCYSKRIQPSSFVVLPLKSKRGAMAALAGGKRAAPLSGFGGGGAGFGQRAQLDDALVALRQRAENLRRNARDLLSAFESNPLLSW